MLHSLTDSTGFWVSKFTIFLVALSQFENSKKGTQRDVAPFSCQLVHSCPRNFAHAPNTLYPYILFTLSSDGIRLGRLFLFGEIGGKLPGIYGGHPHTCSGGNQSTGDNCVTMRLMWRQDGGGEGNFSSLNQTLLVDLKAKHIKNDLCFDANSCLHSQ